jgi:hypothetical protein
MHVRLCVCIDGWMCGRMYICRHIAVLFIRATSLCQNTRSIENSKHFSFVCTDVSADQLHISPASPTSREPLDIHGRACYDVNPVEYNNSFFLSNNSFRPNRSSSGWQEWKIKYTVLNWNWDLEHKGDESSKKTAKTDVLVNSFSTSRNRTLVQIVVSYFAAWVLLSLTHSHTQTHTTKQWRNLNDLGNNRNSISFHYALISSVLRKDVETRFLSELHVQLLRKFILFFPFAPAVFLL